MQYRVLVRRAVRPAAPVFLMAVLVVLVSMFGAGSAAAQQALRVDLFEDPFLCDGGTRIIGSIDGFEAGEQVEFRSPQIDGGLDGIFSTREADDAGVVEMKWSCDAPKNWSVDVIGRSSSRGTSFTITGVQAPPPPDAPLGAAFDARSAMTIEEMAIWKDVSPYNGVGIYLPVDERWDNRADKRQINLTPAWVDAVLADGWRILPIYVAHQAPASCDIGRFVNMSTSAEVARQQGTDAAVDAAAQAGRLGLGPGAPIYLDIEAYRPGCSDAVLAYVAGWTASLRASGYDSGVYGSQNSLMVDLTDAARAGQPDLPDAIWVSTKSGVPTTLGLEAPPDDLWTNARINQFRLSVTRSYGGVTLEVDDNIVDGPVAVWQPAFVDNDGDGHGEPEPDNCDLVANPDQADLDGDGDGDVCDDDIDGDGFANPEPDNCDLIANPDQADLDGDGDGDVCDDDIDGDGFANPEPDNCDLVANPDQADLDGDGDGDVCDDDIDGDFIANGNDPDPAGAAIPVEPTAVPTAPAVAPPDDQVDDNFEEDEGEAGDAGGVIADEDQPSESSDDPPLAAATPGALARPTVTSSADAVPAPTVMATATASVAAAEQPASEPVDGVLEPATVTITTERGTSNPWRTVAIAAAAIVAVGSGAQAVRGFRNR